MSYSNFTLESALAAFQLEKVESAGTFSEIDPITPSAYLTTGLAKKVPLAAAIGTEKARSELIGMTSLNATNNGKTIQASSFCIGYANSQK